MQIANSRQQRPGLDPFEKSRRGRQSAAAPASTRTRRYRPARTWWRDPKRRCWPTPLPQSESSGEIAAVRSTPFGHHTGLTKTATWTVTWEQAGIAHDRQRIRGGLPGPGARDVVERVVLQPARGASLWLSLAPTWSRPARSVAGPRLRMLAETAAIPESRSIAAVAEGPEELGVCGGESAWRSLYSLCTDLAGGWTLALHSGAGIKILKVLPSWFPTLFLMLESDHADGHRQAIAVARAKRFHAGRVAGGDRDHWRAGSAFVARGAVGARGVAAKQVPESFAAVGTGDAQLS